MAMEQERTPSPGSNKALLRAFLIGVPALCILALLEIAAYVIIVVNGSNFYYPLGLTEIQRDGYEPREGSIFDAELGWEPSAPNELGYRGEKKDEANVALAVFGDSYTYGFPELESSWPELLEAKLERPVLNFGVGGYGTGQAYLRFKKRFEGQAQAPYVALFVMSENIARVRNRYRGFYLRKRSVSLTKPMFAMAGPGEFELLPNPLAKEEDIAKLGDGDFLRQIGEGDYWYDYYGERGLNEYVRFPYSYYLTKALPYYVTRGVQHRFRNQRAHEDMYEDAESTAILDFIISKFVADVELQGSIPIVVFLPNWKDLTDYEQSGSTIYGDFARATREKYDVAFADGLDFFRPHLDAGGQVPDFFRSRLDGHYNERGEEVVSEGVFDLLASLDAERGLL